MTTVDEFDLPEDQEGREAIKADTAGAFRIQDDSTATWAMRKARAAKQRLEEIDRIATAEVERIQTWALHERRAPDRDLGFFTWLLEEYALRQRDLDPKRKSIVTPYGTVQTRTKQPAWSVDDDLFLPWAREHRPDLIATVEKPKLAEAKKALSLDGTTVHDAGTVVPGITVTPASLTATVNPETS